jgi:hypothetical protein
MLAPKERRRTAALRWNCQPKTNSTGVIRAQTTARVAGDPFPSIESRKAGMVNEAASSARLRWNRVSAE